MMAGQDLQAQIIYFAFIVFPEFREKIKVTHGSWRAATPGIVCLLCVVGEVATQRPVMGSDSRHNAPVPPLRKG